MSDIIPTNLIQCFGTNAYKALKFIRNLVRNINNTRKISNIIDNKDKIEGYVIGIYSLKGLYNNPKELIINNSRNYYIRYFINIYNTQTRQQYGNTYRSPLFPVEFKQNNSIELDSKNPFYFYLLTQEPKHENIILQIILVEANKEEVILNEKCLGWSILKLVKNKENNENEEEKVFAEINRGTPRDLIHTNYFIKYHGAQLCYIPYKYPKLELINFLLPTNIIIAYNESLPGLRLRNLPEFPDINETLKTVDFITACVKNIVIEINPELEEDIINFGKEYRQDKYKVEENEFNKVYIKERRIKCGIHNTWKFINSNGIQNSITMVKISKNKLQANGVLMIDKFFSDPLSCSAIILELEYVVTIPIKGAQKEEELNLILGYHIYVPEKINEGNYSKEKLLMFTGPGSTIYGDKMWSSGNIDNKNIRISYILSQNANLNYINQVELDDLDKQRLNATQNALVDKNNQRILKGEQMTNNLDESKDIKKDINNRYNEDKIERLQEELAKAKEEKEKMDLKLKQREMSNNTFYKTIGQNISEVSNSLKKEREKTILKETQIKEKTVIPLEESIEYKEFIQFKTKKEIYIKELEEKMELLKEIQKPKVTEYESPIRNISARDKSTLIKKGVMDLALKEQVDAYIDNTLDKELCEQGLATSFIFQFLSFKPSRMYYQDLRNVPEKIKFFFDFFNENKLQTAVCNVTRPEEVKSNNYYYFNNPLILQKENINMNSAILNDTKSEVIIEVKYDPSIDTSIDFRDFVKYLINKRLVVQITDVQKCLNIGYIKIPLKDLIGKDKIQLTKEYEIFDDNFNIRGYIQLLITASKYKTLKPFSYNRNKFTNINSREGYNTLSKKKKVKVAQMDLNKITQDKNFYNLTMNGFKNKNNEKDANLINEMNRSHQRKLRIEPEIEKKIRVMRYFNNKNNLCSNLNNNLSNTNYSKGTKIQLEEKKLNEIKQKQANEDQFINTLKTCEQFRDYTRSEVLSKVSQENHKNVYNITLISGQPIYFNYSVFNDSSIEELCHITIEKINKNKNENNKNIKKEKIVQILSTPLEWRTIVEKEKLKRPNNYEIISDNLDMIIKPGETIPLVVKLLSFIENREEESYSVTIHKKNGQPLYYLLINIKKVFPIYDHIFHYYFPLDNRAQRVILKNPFGQTKTMQMLNNVYITNNIVLALDEDTHDFNFMLEPDNYNYQNDFIIFFYSDEARTKLYLTWKIEIDWIEASDIKIAIQGKKINSLLNINNNPQLNKEAYAGNNITLQLFTDSPDIVLFPQDSRNPFSLNPNTIEQKNFILYPKNNKNNSAVINCVNIYTRNLFKRWIIKYETRYPEIDEIEIIECVIGGQNLINYNYTNPTNKFLVLAFYSGNEEVLEIIDRVASFNIGESKDIKFKIHDKGNLGKEEVLVFISDDNDEFCRTILFKINFKEN